MYLTYIFNWQAICSFCYITFMNRSVPRAVNALLLFQESLQKLFYCFIKFLVYYDICLCFICFQEYLWIFCVNPSFFSVSQLSGPICQVLLQFCQLFILFESQEPIFEVCLLFSQLYSLCVNFQDVICLVTYSFFELSGSRNPFFQVCLPFYLNVPYIISLNLSFILFC